MRLPQQHRLVRTRAEAHSIVAFQWWLACLGAGVLLFMKGFLIAFAYLLGGMVGFVPTWLLYRLFFKYSGALMARRIWMMLCIGECLKFVLTGLALALLFGYTAIPALWILVGFLMTFLGYWWALVRQILKRTDE